MNNMLYIVLVSLVLSSCGSLKNTREIHEAKYDGLKLESLKRYDEQRLAPSLKSKSPLSMCHRKKFDKAIESFKETLDENLENSHYWNQISTCYIIKKDYNKAKNFLQIAMNTAKTNKEKSSILNNLGVIHLENKNFHEAKNYFKQSISISKVSLTPRYNLAQVFLKYGLYKNAAKEIDILLSSNKNDIDFLNSKAHLELMLGHYKEALSYFNKIPQRYKSRDDIATNIAMTYFMLGYYDEAKDTLSNARNENSFYSVSQLEISKKIEKKKSGK